MLAFMHVFMFFLILLTISAQLLWWSTSQTPDLSTGNVWLIVTKINKHISHTATKTPPSKKQSRKNKTKKKKMKHKNKTKNADQFLQVAFYKKQNIRWKQSI